MLENLKAQSKCGFSSNKKTEVRCENEVLRNIFNLLQTSQKCGITNLNLFFFSKLISQM